MIKPIFDMLSPLFNFLDNPDSIKGNTPTLKEQEAAERLRKKFLKKRKCGQCNCK